MPAVGLGCERRATTSEPTETMKPIMKPNIGPKGRLARGLCAAALFLAAWFAWGLSPWLGLGLGACGAFALFEALRGWCALRAFGLKTRI